MNQDEKEDVYEQAVYYVRTSEHAEAIARELAKEGLRRPSEVLEEVKQQTGVTRSNFYDTLRRLEGTVVEKIEGPGRATLYQLTDAGERVSKEFGLSSASVEEADSATITADQSPPEAFRTVMDVMGITVEEAQIALDRIKHEEDSKLSEESDQESTQKKSEADALKKHD